MSARSTLARAMTEGPCPCGYSDCPRPDFLIDAFKVEVLREAAEKIRNENPDRSPDWSDGTDWAADLIDPDKDTE